MAVTGASGWTLSNGSTHPTGFWAEELIAPHKIFNAAGWEVEIATPGGASSRRSTATASHPEYTGADEAGIAALERYLESIDDELSSASRLESLEPADHDILFAPGGHGPMEDLAVSNAMGSLIIGTLDEVRKVVGDRLPRVGGAAVRGSSRRLRGRSPGTA